MADLLAKGLPHVQVGNSVVEDGLHDPARRRETLRRGFAVIPLPVVCVCVWGGILVWKCLRWGGSQVRQGAGI